MKNILKNLDYPLLIATLILSAFGLLMIFSASSITAVLLYKKPETYFFMKQVIIFGGAIFAGGVVASIPLNAYRHFKLYLLMIFGTIGLLLILKIYGSVTNNAQSWLAIPGTGFNIQPSEFAKTLSIIYLATAYGRRTKFKGKFDPLVPLLPCIVVFFLITIEPDLGTALIYSLIVMFVFFAIPFDKKNMTIKAIRILSIVGIVLGGIFLYNAENIMSENQKSRIMFSHPCDRMQLETGYQVCNGYIAMNNGGIWGVGLGKSKQKYLYLPAAHTDFIYPIIIEEWGLIGGGLVLLIYLFILYRILAIAKHAQTLQGSLIALGAFALITIHIIINLGGVLALIPITGVPLPFLSYGGSVGLNLGLLIGFTERVAIESKMPKKKKIEKQVS